jgi:hypothetical protein
VTVGRTAKRAGWIAGGGAAAAALLGLGCVGAAWYRYGRVAGPGRPSPLLDRFMPRYEIHERHETRVAAPVATTYAAARELDLRRSRLVRAIFRGRELLLGSDRATDEGPPGLLAQAVRQGWAVLAETPGREIVLGAVTRPWEANVRFRGLPPERFAAFDEPGFVKIAWTLSAEPRGPAGSTARTETRVVATDPAARERFRRYWAVFSPGIRLIRRRALRLVRADAEQRYRAETAPRAEPAPRRAIPPESRG